MALPFPSPGAPDQGRGSNLRWVLESTQSEGKTEVACLVPAGTSRIPGLITAGSRVGGGSGSLFHAKLSFPFFKQKLESTRCGLW